MNIEKESLIKTIEKETGIKNPEVTDIMIIDGNKMLSVDYTTEPGDKKTCYFSIKDNKIDYGICFLKNINKNENI